MDHAFCPLGAVRRQRRHHGPRLGCSQRRAVPVALTSIFCDRPDITRKRRPSRRTVSSSRLFLGRFSPAERASASLACSDSAKTNSPYNNFSANGNSPLNPVSQPGNALQGNAKALPTPPIRRPNTGNCCRDADSWGKRVRPHLPDCQASLLPENLSILSERRGD